MAINFTIGTSLTNDQTAGVQTPTDGNDVNVTLTSNELDGLDSGFETFLAGLGLSSNQKNFAVSVDAADSNATFIQISATGGETINDIKLIANSSTATSWTTLAGEALYLHVDGTGNYATLTTSAGSGGRIVAAFALTDEVINNTTHTGSAGVQFVTFEGINHPDATNPDDTLALGDVLKVAVDTAVSFNFEQLDAGNFLWAAVGSSSSAMLITGQDLNVKDTGSPAQIGNIDKGGTDPSDAVNTSKATDTTIGINAQHFAPTNAGDGAVGVFTFVSGFTPLEGATPTYTGQNVKQIDYDGYLNVSAASVFISQLTGGTTAKMSISLWEAGGGGTDKAPGDLLPEEGYSTDPTNKYSYIGNEDTDSNLTDDIACNVATVTIGANTWSWNEANIVTGVTKGGITVWINGNDIVVDGANANDLISFTALDSGGSAVDGTFNRIDIQALQGSAAFDIGHIDLTQGGQTSEGLGSHLYADDDGPTLTAQPGGSATPNNLQVDNDLSDSSDSSDSSSYGLAAGTDGQKSYMLVGPEDSTGDFQWTYDDSTHTAITGTYLGADLYTLVLNPSTGGYTFTMTDELPGSTLDLSPAEVIKAGSPDEPTLEIGAAQNDDFVRMSADSTVGNGNINESHGFVGVDNGNLDAGESLTFTLHEADGDPLTFEGIQIGTKSAQGGTYDWEAHLVGGGTLTGTEIVGKNGTIIVDSDDLNGETIDSITITKVSGPATKIGIGDIHIIIPPDDVQLGFTVELKDNDNDTTTQNFVVDIDANNDGSYDATVNSLSIINPAGLASSVDTSSAMKIEALSYLHTSDYHMV